MIAQTYTHNERAYMRAHTLRTTRTPTHVHTDTPEVRAALHAVGWRGTLRALAQSQVELHRQSTRDAAQEIQRQRHAVRLTEENATLKAQVAVLFIMGPEVKSNAPEPAHDAPEQPEVLVQEVSNA